MLPWEPTCSTHSQATTTHLPWLERGRVAGGREGRVGGWRPRAREHMCPSSKVEKGARPVTLALSLTRSLPGTLSLSLFLFLSISSIGHAHTHTLCLSLSLSLSLSRTHVIGAYRIHKLKVRREESKDIDQTFYSLTLSLSIRLQPLFCCFPIIIITNVVVVVDVKVILNKKKLFKLKRLIWEGGTWQTLTEQSQN